MRRGNRISLGIAAVFLMFIAGFTPANAQSFNCRYAKTPDEVLICQDNQLAKLDIKLASIYSRYLNLLKGRELRKLQNDQTEWFASRMAGGRDAFCILDKYQQRISYLYTHAPDVCDGPILTQPRECNAGGQYQDEED